MRSQGRFVWAFPLLALFVYASFTVDSNLSGVRRFLKGNEEKVQEASSAEPKSNGTHHPREQQAERLQLGETPPVRPIVYTFFELQKNADSKVHDALILVWKELWSNAGWEPKVLTLLDAKKHPDYKHYSDILIKSNNMGNVNEGTYDHLCFVRWLAMAAQSTGGWMSDYDTFPLGISVNMGLHLPNNGEFTSYQRHVPALMSGTQEEWERMAHAVMEQAITTVKPKDLPSTTEKPNSNFYSDMLALLDASVQDSSLLHYGIKGAKHNIAVSDYEYTEEEIVDCDFLEETGVLAVHLSHSATARALTRGTLRIPSGKSKHDRDYFARALTKQWKEQCKPNFDDIMGGGDKPTDSI